MYLSMVNLLSALVLSLLAVVGAVPAWEAGRSTISSLVPGAGYLEALAAARGTEGITRHVTVTDLSSPGNVTVMVHTKRPATFFVNHNQLWQFYNETAIYRVNLINATHIENHPLQLVTSKKAEGVTGGVWRWSGTMLYYDHGRRGNQGLYYHCDSDTMKGVYIFLSIAPTPPGCKYMTFHSWSRDWINNQNRKRIWA